MTDTIMVNNPPLFLIDMSDWSDGWFHGSECSVCDEPVTDEKGISIEHVRRAWVDEEGKYCFELDTYIFCSNRCLFKWTWDQMIPTHLEYPVDAPRSVIELDSKVGFNEIEERRKDLLRYIGVLREK